MAYLCRSDTLAGSSNGCLAFFAYLMHSSGDHGSPTFTHRWLHPWPSSPLSLRMRVSGGMEPALSWMLLLVQPLFASCIFVTNAISSSATAKAMMSLYSGINLSVREDLG